MTDYDVAVIGGGAAGLSAALVLARARRRVVIIDAGAPRNAPAAHMHGFLSRDGMVPGELLAVGRKEVKRYGGQMISAEVADVAATGSAGFAVVLPDGFRIASRRLLVATGLRDELPNLPGLHARWGRDVLHCPYCHGYEVRDRRLGVLGGSSDAVRYAQIVRQWTNDVVFFSQDTPLRVTQHAELAARAICIVDGPVDQVVVENDRLSGVQMQDGRRIPRDALFVPPRFVPHSQLLVRLGCAVDDNGWPVIDAYGLTTVPGVWAAGNVANPRAQVITAAGEGSTAAIAINADLVDDDVRIAVHAACVTSAQ